MPDSYRVLIKVNVRPDTPVGWLGKAKAVTSITNQNASQFTSIASLLAQLGSDTTELDKAQSVAANRGKEEIKTRNAKLLNVKKSLRAVAHGVEGLCEAAPDAEHAKAIAAAAGFDVKIVTPAYKADLSAKVLGNGRVHLYARVPGTRPSRIFYEWQVSTDGGKTWASLPITNDADLLVENLTPSTTVTFRHRYTVKNVPSEWHQQIAVLVH